MKKQSIAIVLGLALAAWLGAAWLLQAQSPTSAAPGTPRYEVAMIKWDGPDRVQFMMPDRTELVRVYDTTPLPRNMQEEEFCLHWAASRLAKDGWEPVNLNSRRILMRRVVSR